jgi:hypothetical protein
VSTLALLIGIALIVLGVAGFVATGSTAKTALIPTYFGIVLGLLGLLARRPARRKLAMHLALVIAVLGLAGSLRGAIQWVSGTAERPAAALAQTIMAALLLVFLLLGIKSFIDARRAR